jgi:hypothetical protein
LESIAPVLGHQNHHMNSTFDQMLGTFRIFGVLPEKKLHRGQTSTAEYALRQFGLVFLKQPLNFNQVCALSGQNHCSVRLFAQSTLIDCMVIFGGHSLFSARFVVVLFFAVLL